MYLCISDIDFDFFYDFAIEFLYCSEQVVYSIFPFIRTVSVIQYDSKRARVSIPCLPNKAIYNWQLLLLSLKVYEKRLVH